MEILKASLKRIQDNDPEMKELVVNGAVWKLNSSAHLEALVTGLMNNTVLEVLRLADCGLTDGDINVLMPAIQTNAAIKILDLSKNKITNVGALALAEALRSNQGIKEIVLIDNPRHGDAVIQAMAAMLAEQNITLTKITWRQELTRNKEIERRIRQGIPFDTLDPRKKPEDAAPAPAQDEEVAAEQQGDE